ncbi:HAD family hydrolase [Terrilactibacillus laevilacticus]|uniref:HAD family hydrolase n=1 Tax=Terrilactibacillus laevilacticus TaxID=1380157 RepID=A0ABW5PSI9_9BACI|nr:HAD family hydrolase [Terrilactibacillus laevilacticus]
MVKTVLFDVDGVFLSEERYFDASALTVWELLNSKNYLGLNPETFKTTYRNDEIEQIRKTVFVDDQVLNFMKSRGLNANWDMIYIAFSYQLIHLLEQVKDQYSEQITKWFSQDINYGTLNEIREALKDQSVSLDFTVFLDDYKQTNATKQGLVDYLNTLTEQKLGVDTSIFKKKSALWSVGEHASQEWYVGDKNILQSTGRPSVQTGKAGFLSEEDTLAEPEVIAELFNFLNQEGIKVGIGTGRPRLETHEPFTYLKWLDHLDTNHIVTADDVAETEKASGSDHSLSKPHPYTYLQAYYGKDHPYDAFITDPKPLENGKDVLVVGDSLADLLAARQIGCQFAAVLTGLSGQAARGEFEEHGADYILDSVVDVKKLISQLVEK